ncbi:MAG: hypothetical protein J7M21_01255, partial [Planctomycetes bacterium]|nr:hypothetical protein [Planctomycetota bacterium]
MLLAELPRRAYILELIDMMASVSLQFQGVKSPQLPLAVLSVIVLVVVAWGIWQLARRRVRYGLLCLAAAAGPVVFAPAMLLDAVIRYAAGNRRGGAASLLAAVAAGLGGGAAALLVLADRAGLWMALLAVETALVVGVFYSQVYAHL